MDTPYRKPEEMPKLFRVEVFRWRNHMNRYNDGVEKVTWEGRLEMILLEFHNVGYDLITMTDDNSAFTLVFKLRL